MISRLSAILLVAKVILSSSFNLPAADIPIDHFFVENLHSGVISSTSAALLLSANDVAVKSSSISAPFIGGSEFLRGLVSGAVSRVSKEILLHPFDTVRARQQFKTTSANNRETTKIDTKSDTPGLFSNLYAGLVPALVGGIPAGSVFFGVKDYVKAVLKSAGNNPVPYLGPLSREEITIMSVAAANVFYWLIRSPAEEIKTKRQVGQQTDSLGLESLTKLKEEYQRSGVRGVGDLLYGSYLSNFAYALPADIAKFVAYEYVSAALFHVEAGAKMTGVNAAVAGALAGLIAQIVTTPLDVSRTRIMTQEKQAAVPGVNEAAPSKNPLQVLLRIVREEGPGQLWAGIVPRAARAIGSGAIQFASYELSQNFMQSGVNLNL